MMTEGNRDNVWRPPKLFTVYQNKCKLETDKAACQTNFEKVFDCVTPATAIPEDPAGCTTACTTAAIPITEALNHDKCSFKCDKVAHLSTATYQACVTDAKTAATAIIPTHEVPGKKDEDPYFCCNKEIEEKLFNKWQDWDTCQFSEPTTCNPPSVMGDCKNHYSTALVAPASPVGSRGIRF